MRGARVLCVVFCKIKEKKKEEIGEGGERLFVRL
jgi:hypothetical protein